MQDLTPLLLRVCTLTQHVAAYVESAGLNVGISAVGSKMGMIPIPFAPTLALKPMLFIESLFF